MNTVEVKQPIIDPLSHDRFDVRTTSRIVPPALAAMNANRYLTSMLLGIVTNVVSLINSLGGTVPKLSKKRSNIQLWKKYDIAVSLNIGKMLPKWQMYKTFQYPNSDVDYN